MEAFVKGYFRTTICSTGANLQRLVGSPYHRWLPRVNYRRELLVLSDRGLVALDWLNENRPGSQSRPWRSLLPALTAVVFRGLVVNGHGCGGVPLSGPRITNAASVSVFALVVSKAPKRYPRECLLAAGVCLGGQLLSLYLRQRGPPAQLDAALDVSPPFEPAVTAHPPSISWGCNMLSNVCIARGCVGRLRAGDVICVWKLASFDQHYAAAAFGFQSVPVFYENCRSKGWLCMVQRPLVFLLSADDSLNPKRTLLEDEVVALAGRRGESREGHMGSVDG
ncbi:hypothetical protein V5799_023639 [Amblyomma americanum]|uniref:Uncharacterized protein n=1 Tax=Amblyomma americanum TaxID=6943 RepID=A0AAQ4FGX7_AMBAM